MPLNGPVPVGAADDEHLGIWNTKLVFVDDLTANLGGIFRSLGKHRQNIHLAGIIDGDRKADLRRSHTNSNVDSNGFPLSIEQWTAAVFRSGRHIGLDQV